MQVRCCCCGKWLVRYSRPRQEQQIFCDGCDPEGDPAWRMGPGTGQCQACKITPNWSHWNDKRPVLSGYICVR